MGYYINHTPEGENLPNVGKLKALGDAVQITVPDFQLIPKDKVLLCEVLNAEMGFSALAYCFSREEFNVFNNRNDRRPKMWALANKTWVNKYTHYARH